MIGSRRLGGVVAALLLACGCSSNIDDLFETPLVVLSGAVYANDGTPERAQIEVLGRLGTTNPYIDNFNTDAAGRFFMLVPPGPYRLIAWGYYGHMAATTVTAPHRSVALHLDRPGTFLGVVQPGSYGGFTTWAIGEWGSGRGVDSSGAYQLDLIPSGSWTIRFTRTDATGATRMAKEIVATMPGPGQTVTLPPVQLTPVSPPATAAPYTP